MHMGTLNYSNGILNGYGISFIDAPIIIYPSIIEWLVTK